MARCPTHHFWCCAPSVGYVVFCPSITSERWLRSRGRRVEDRQNSILSLTTDNFIAITIKSKHASSHIYSCPGATDHILLLLWNKHELRHTHHQAEFLSVIIPWNFFFFFEKGLTVPGWPGTQRDLPTSASQVLRLKVCTTMPGAREHY